MTFPTYFHLTARVAPNEIPFPSRDTCAELWRRLRETFPGALATILMPSHVHTVTTAQSREAGLSQLGHALSGFNRQFSLDVSWRTSTRQEPIQDRLHLQRQIRYVLLNPCRDRLVKDPLEWEWSTYRDLMGAAAPPWPLNAELQRFIGFQGENFVSKFHAYISGDPSVAIGGTAPPRLAKKGAGIIATPPHLVEAVLTAMRQSKLRQRQGEDNARKILVHLAKRNGIGSQSKVAEWVGIAPRTVRELQAAKLSTNQENIVQAVLNLLAEPRYGIGRNPPFLGGLGAHN